MASDKSPPAGRFRRAHLDLDGSYESALLNFEMLDFESSPATVWSECWLNDLRQMVQANLKALAFFGYQPATGLVRMLERSHA